MSTPMPSQPYTPPPGYQLKKKTPWWKKGAKLGCGLVAVLFALGIIGIAVGGGDDDTAPSGGDTTATASASKGASSKGDAGVPAEYRSALKAAQRYVKTLPMSKAGLYRQLTSEFDQHSEDAAQYAVDNVTVDWNEQALKAARTYQDDLAMSPAAIYDQLTSDVADAFTPEEAQYAVDNL